MDMCARLCVCHITCRSRISMFKSLHLGIIAVYLVVGSKRMHSYT